LKGVTFFKKLKIKKKIFKKNTLLLRKIDFSNFFNKTKIKPMFFLNKFNKNYELTNSTQIDNFYINISQKLHNPKGLINKKKNLYTMSVGSIVKYFNIKDNKYIRRTLKGNKIFLNFLKNILQKKYTFINNNIILVLNGFDYNMFYYKNFFKNLLKNKKTVFYFLINLKINFNKRKNKKVKSIKKRLKKKILLNFRKEIKKRN
jgi:hypothetical protein